MGLVSVASVMLQKMMMVMVVWCLNWWFWRWEPLQYSWKGGAVVLGLAKEVWLVQPVQK